MADVRRSLESTRGASPSRAIPRGLIAGVFAVLLTGCFLQPKVGSPDLLPKPKPSRTSVSLDVVTLRIPYGDPEFNGPLWTEIDEQRIPAAVRRGLAAHGLRAGVIGGPVPTFLEQRMNTGEKPTTSEAGELLNLENENKVAGRYLQLPAGKRSEIQTTQVLDELPVLFPVAGGLAGKTYVKAQGVLEVKATPIDDGRIRMSVLPEVQHGDPKNRFTPAQDGVLFLDPGRDRATFPELVIDAVLAPGEMLIMCGSVDRPGSLGDQIFSDRKASPREQKVILIRVSATPIDEGGT
ncbi:MAG TPA: hypothetical protein VGE52_04145 [Pirellulales bacterium]